MHLDHDEYENERMTEPVRKKPLKNRLYKQDSRLGLLEGRVTFISPEAIHVVHDSQIYLCSIKGTLKKQLKQDQNRICCGDLVYFDAKKQVIEQLKERATVLMRQNPSQKYQEQILATNITQLLITSSVVQPILNTYLIDLYVITAQKANLRPVILINKIDLLLEKMDSLEHALLKELQEQYSALNIPVILVSATSQKGFKELEAIMKNQASVFSGESGVGKSSLINAIEQISLKVGALNYKGLKGTHTTTSARLMPLSFGGWCVDTPGVQSIGFKDLPPIEIRNSFPELTHCGCKFSDCLHQTETGCKIKEALEEKKVFRLRLDSYYRLLKETDLSL